MAIDTAKKRRQALRTVLGLSSGFLPAPDNEVDKLDRAFVWFAYFEGDTPIIVVVGRGRRGAFRNKPFRHGPFYNTPLQNIVS